jgi:hypothetical protein
MLAVIRFLVEKGVSPDDILKALPETARTRRFVTLPGRVEADDVAKAFADLERQGKRVDFHRYFHEPDELLYADGDTWLLTKMWGIKTERCLEALRAAFPQHHIVFKTAE